MRKEVVDIDEKAFGGNKAMYANSLYRMDLDRHNIKKLAFNLNEMKNFDEDMLYFYKNETLTFKSKIPVDKNHTETIIKEYDVVRYIAFNKKTSESKVQFRNINHLKVAVSRNQLKKMLNLRKFQQNMC